MEKWLELSRKGSSFAADNHRFWNMPQSEQKCSGRSETAFMDHRGNPLREQSDFVGKSEKMLEIRKLISLVAPSRISVLILGETGTGKELIARSIHKAGDRSDGPFVIVNAGALPDNLLESELFGYKKGAFTGAQTDKTGLLEISNGGTFFADELGDMDLSIQAKLLRVIETGRFRKVGDTTEKKVDVRLVCATNKNLEKEVQRKTFRSDLFYRLSVFTIEVPPLRERKEDIPLLVDHFLRKMAEEKESVSISAEALDRIMGYSWPGNVRELANTLQRAYILSSKSKIIGTDALPITVLTSSRINTRKKSPNRSFRLIDLQREHINDILASTDGNKARAARILGISRPKLYSLLKEGHSDNII